MSRTNKTLDGPINPTQCWLKWDSETARWKSWDKEKKENIFFESNGDEGIKFICLDSLSTVTGFDEANGTGIYSNEVRNTKQEKLTVFSGKQKIAVGLWQDIKSLNNGMKFATSLYAMAKINGEYHLANLKLSGCALGPWIEFTLANGGIRNLYEDTVISVTDVKSDKKGRVEYTSPVFGIVGRSLSPEASKKADDLDHLLQNYLDGYFNRDDASVPNFQTMEPEALPTEEYDEIPF